MNAKIINEFVETVNGAVRQISGDAPKNDPNSYSETSKTSDEIVDKISTPNMSPWGTSFGLGYITGPVFEGEINGDNIIDEQVIDKSTLSAFDLLSVNEEAPSVDDTEDGEYIERTKYFITIFNDFFDDEEKVKSLNLLFKNIDLQIIDDKYKKSILDNFKISLFKK